MWPTGTAEKKKTVLLSARGYALNHKNYHKMHVWGVLAGVNAGGKTQSFLVSIFQGKVVCKKHNRDKN